MKKALTIILAILGIAGLAVSSTECFGLLSGFVSFAISFPVILLSGFGLVGMHTDNFKDYGYGSFLRPEN